MTKQDVRQNTRNAALEAIVEGLEYGDKFHHKLHYRAVSIRVALEDAGLVIVKRAQIRK